MKKISIVVVVVSFAICVLGQPLSGHGRTEFPSASQQIGSAQGERQQAEEQQHTKPTLVGCLSSSGDSKQEFFLVERMSGTRYRLSASREELKDHVNHLVELVGKPGNGESGASAVASSNNEPVFQVTGVQDLAPTCGAAR